jgi:two-component sensor histidine kinase
MTGGFLEGDLFRGLAFRILLFLSLALLPFGLIAVVQTRELADQAKHTFELSLLGLTEQAAGAERAVIQEAIGVAATLSSVAPVFRDDPEGCAAFMSEYMRTTPLYSFIGLLPPDGMIDCSSAGRSYDASQGENFTRLMGAIKRSVVLNSAGPLSGEPVVIITEPIEENGVFEGYVMLSIPLAKMRELEDPPADRRPGNLVIFNAEGKILTSERTEQETLGDLPANRSLAALVGSKPAVFRDVSVSGVERTFAVVPIVPGVVYSMSIWREMQNVETIAQTGRLGLFLPILMWLASLVVAFWSINRLALRHIRTLGRQMRLFAYNRSMPRSTMGQGVPHELVEIQQAFVGMAESIIRDEAALEDSLRDKNILLKEVHHRVKNNLQLISSIMNMQIRKAQSEDAQYVLKRLQDRILSLATVHKNLYQNDLLQRVDAGALVKDIVEQLLVVGLPAGSRVKVTQSYDTVEMDADDAAPLTLLISEAVTNALKYTTAPKIGERATLAITLRRDGLGAAVFEITNSATAETSAESTGLGSQLINAFARQLNAQVEVSRGDGLHRLILSFPVTSGSKLVRDF